MANKEQLAILKQGVDVWNRWREDNPNLEIDLSKANLDGLHLHRINLFKANLRKTDLDSADLSGADLEQTNMELCSLYKANLHAVNLQRANLWAANLVRANLTQSILYATSFRNASFSNSNLEDADLSSANLRDAILIGTNLSNTFLENTTFGRNDLSTAIGLNTVKHNAPSIMDFNTIQLSQGKIPLEFLRGCGLSDLDIEYTKLANPELTTQEVSEITHRIFELKDTRPIQISPLFISYSHANSAFVDKLETKLNEKGIRFWRDIHDAKAGRLETQIDRAIRHNPTVLLILSEHSTSSDWVEHEARLARKLEKELGRDVLCPIALDDSWKTCNWPERIKEQIMEYNILDFSNWENDAALDKIFKKLIDGLDMFYKK